MDSFTILFVSALGPAEVSQALQSAGFNAHTQSATGAVSISSGDAHVWVGITKGQDLLPADCEDASEWPISRDQVGALATVDVRRNSESEDLAIRVADALLSKFAGAILWDGMYQWEDLYNAYQERKRQAR